MIKNIIKGIMVLTILCTILIGATMISAEQGLASDEVEYSGESGGFDPSIEDSEVSTISPTIPHEIMIGDANDDGSLDLKDVLIIRKYIAKFPVEINGHAADVNRDESIDLKDVLILRKNILYPSEP